MSRIAATFRELRAARRGGLIPFLMAGDPGLEETPGLVAALGRGGADIIELGVPFSDPVADGPTIQAAARRALDSGTTLRRVLELIRGLPTRDLPPLVLMSYYNPVFRFGPSRLVREMARSGAAGLIVVDLPPEECGPLRREADRAGIDLILLVAPNTPPERARAIGALSSGFLYCVSRMGTTGARDRIPPELTGWMKKVRGMVDLPLAVGFGVSTASQVRRLWKVADAAVVGSLLVEEVAKKGRGLEGRLAALLRGLRGPAA